MHHHSSDKRHSNHSSHSKQREDGHAEANAKVGTREWRAMREDVNGTREGGGREALGEGCRGDAEAKEWTTSRLGNRPR